VIPLADALIEPRIDYWAFDNKCARRSRS